MQPGGARKRTHKKHLGRGAQQALYPIPETTDAPFHSTLRIPGITKVIVLALQSSQTIPRLTLKSTTQYDQVYSNVIPLQSNKERINTICNISQLKRN